MNDWLKNLITSSGTLNENPTGYYVWLSLLVNNPLLRTADIKELDLTNGYLKKIPKNFSKLENLEKLNLQKNKLATISDEVFQLNNLVSLHLGWNDITTIPDKISELVNLKTLMIGNNSLEDISDNIGNLKNLHHLDIGSNFFSKFPNSICKIKSLININYISFNDEYGLDEEISKTIKKHIPNVIIAQPVKCNECGSSDDDFIYRAEDMCASEFGYACESCWENHFTYYYCDCCSIFVAPRGYTGDNRGEVYQNQGGVTIDPFVRWFSDTTVEDDSDDETRTIIKEEDGSIKDKLICELCIPNISENDKPSYEDTEKYAEENGIEYWDN